MLHSPEKKKVLQKKIEKLSRHFRLAVLFQGQVDTKDVDSIKLQLKSLGLATAEIKDLLEDFIPPIQKGQHEISLDQTIAQIEGEFYFTDQLVSLGAKLGFISRSDSATLRQAIKGMELISKGLEIKKYAKGMASASMLGAYGMAVSRDLDGG